MCVVLLAAIKINLFNHISHIYIVCRGFEIAVVGEACAALTINYNVLSKAVSRHNPSRSSSQQHRPRAPHASAATSSWSSCEHDSARLHGEAKLPYASAVQTPLRCEMEVQANAHLGALGSAGLSWRHVAEGDKCASLCGGVVVVLVGGIDTMFDYGWEWV